MADKTTSRLPVLAGLAFAGSGLVHVVKPALFEGLSKSTFPDNTARYVQINGGIETAIGLCLLSPKTRKLALLGSVGYGVYLVANTIRNR